jgi:isopenicillin-N epimerase
VKKPRRTEFARHWTLDPDIVFLNHGSFGATPRPVLDVQTEIRARMERQPVRFLTRELEPLLDGARRTLATFLGADAEGLAFVPNATAAVNAVLRSLDLDKHDELLTTNHEYNACRNALDYVAASSGARVIAVPVPFPGTTPHGWLEPILAAVSDRTRLVLVDHITSPTAVVNPIEALIAELSKRGVDVLIDGAHAPGMLAPQVGSLGAAYYTGNLHKWVCTPKGSAFLWVRKNRRQGVRPVAISHGANSTRTDRSRYHLEFDWTGTFDPSAWLSAPSAIDFMGSLLPGGWPELMERNRRLAIEGKNLLCRRLSVAPPVPESMLGSMAAIPLPDGSATAAPSLYGDPLQDALFERHGIEVPVVPWPAPPHRLVRISAQIYNTIEEVEYLAEALVEELARETG